MRCQLDGVHPVAGGASLAGRHRHIRNVLVGTIGALCGLIECHARYLESVLHPPRFSSGSRDDGDRSLVAASLVPNRDGRCEDPRAGPSGC